MKNITVSKRIRFAAFAALGILLALNAPVRAEGGHGGGGHGGGGFGGGHGGGGFGGGHGGGMEHHGFEGHHFEGHDEGHHFEGRHFEGHDFDRHDFDGRFGFGFGLGLGYPYSEPYYAAPSYWYYCQSYGAYYPSVTSCPEAWVTVPAE